jgi:ADP-ribose pyrophosphatase YjhB (NUDIX family)
MILQVGVKVLLRNSAGKFLLLKRNTEKYKNVKGTWDIVGGRINPGTALLENLIREVKEETDLDLTDIPALVAAQDILTLDQRHIVRLTYTARINGQPKLSEESTEYNWFSLEELKNHQDLDIYCKMLIEEGKLNNVN